MPQKTEKPAQALTRLELEFRDYLLKKRRLSEKVDSDFFCRRTR